MKVVQDPSPCANCPPLLRAPKEELLIDKWSKMFVHWETRCY